MCSQKLMLKIASLLQYKVSQATVELLGDFGTLQESSRQEQGQSHFVHRHNVHFVPRWPASSSARRTPTPREHTSSHWHRQSASTHFSKSAVTMPSYDTEVYVRAAVTFNTSGGTFHKVENSRWLYNFPPLTLLSSVSRAITLGFWGLGYFLYAARAITSHGWLQWTCTSTVNHTRGYCYW